MAKKRKPEDVHHLMQTDLLKQPWLLDMFGKSELNPDGITFDHDRDETGTAVFMCIEGALAAAIQKLDDNYQAFVSPFARWAEGHGLHHPGITTLDDSPNTLVFEVYI